MVGSYFRVELWGDLGRLASIFSAHVTANESMARKNKRDDDKVNFGLIKIDFLLFS